MRAPALRKHWRRSVRPRPVSGSGAVTPRSGSERERSGQAKRRSQSRPGQGHPPVPVSPAAPACSRTLPPLRLGFSGQTGMRVRLTPPNLFRSPEAPGQGPRRAGGRLSPAGTWPSSLRVAAPQPLSSLSCDSGHCISGHPRPRGQRLETLSAVTSAKTLCPRPDTTWAPGLRTWAYLVGGPSSPHFDEPTAPA